MPNTVLFAFFGEALLQYANSFAGDDGSQPIGVLPAGRCGAFISQVNTDLLRGAFRHGLACIGGRMECMHVHEVRSAIADKGILRGFGIPYRRSYRFIASKWPLAMNVRQCSTARV